MTPRKRRGVLLLVLAAFGAILVFSSISSYVDGVRKDLNPKRSVLVLTRNVPELQPIPIDALRTKAVPAKYAGPATLRDPADIGGLVPTTDLQAGVELQRGMLIEPAGLKPGEREISILINADTGVAGKLRPGDNVDVLATFPADDNNRSPASARTLIRRARVITIGLPRAAARPGSGQPDQRTAAAAGATQQVLVPVSFALRPTLALRLTYAETFASEIRMALIRPGDEDRPLAAGKREFTLPATIAKSGG